MMKNLFNCLVCCASTSGGVFSDEFEKSILFDFLCGMLNVELPEEYSWDFSREHFPLCLRCCCVIRDMFQLQMLTDSVELSVIETAEKMKQTIYDGVQLRRKLLLKNTSKMKTTDNSDTTEDFQDDARFEFFRNQVIDKNCEQLTKTLKISVKRSSITSDSTRALDQLLADAEKMLENNENLLFRQDVDSAETLSKNTVQESSLDCSSSSKTDPLPDSDTLDFQWPSWEEWENFPLPSASDETNEDINTASEDDALYQALIKEKCDMDINPLLDKANLPSCSVTYDESFVPHQAVEDKRDESEPIEQETIEQEPIEQEPIEPESPEPEPIEPEPIEPECIDPEPIEPETIELASNEPEPIEPEPIEPEKNSNVPSNDSCEVITISDDSQDSDDDCAIIETNNNGKEKPKIKKKTAKYSKTVSTNSDNLHIVLTTHSIVTDANNPEGNTSIVIEQKTPIQVRSGIFMAVAGSQDTWQCILCGKIVRNFKNHKAVHFPGQFQCTLCQAVFKRKDNLLAHHKTKH